ncbi:MAG TPA: hypothetical protein VGF55_22640 [Gemmataceae bacterium]|jgi:hypothetical protein
MRTGLRYALVGLLLLPAVATAQSPRDRVQVQYVRVGFPPGPTDPADEAASAVATRDSLYKAGAWTPVYVTLVNVGKYDRKKDGPAEVIVETPDCDDTINGYAAPVPEFDEKEGLAGQASVIAYTRTGSRYGETTIRVVAGGKDLCQPFKLGMAAAGFQNAAGLEPNQGLYVALGSRLPGLRSLGARDRDPNQPQPPNAVNLERKSAVALVARVAELPTQWFGYAGADVVILSTSDRDFTTALVSDPVRSAALAEWVRRGGRLAVSGRNLEVLAGAAELAALLPVDVGKQYQAPSLTVTWREGGVHHETALADPDPAKSLALRQLTPRDKPPRPHRVLVDGPRDVPDATPVVVQGPYGLGRVTVVGMDLDQPPFTRWAGQADFWKQLLARSGPRIPDSAIANPNIIRYAGQQDPSADGELRTINSQLEAFEGVPVISFGWVALFILLYILVVGPLDYLFLKKVVKRLELTWVTFPTVVLAVSAAAYFTAYHLKGSELRVNKLDVVDVDHQTGRAYGRTWFSVFSPRIQKYTIGVEPAAPWAVPADATEPAAVVSWFGESRQGRQSLFRHSYDYAPGATGLRGVPIQVWTTKGFQADWAAPLDKEKPVVESRLRHPPGRPDDLIGSVTSHLPVPLEDVLMIYRGEVAALGSLLPDTPKAVTAQTRIKFSTLRENPSALATAGETRAGEGGSAAVAQVTGRLPLGLLFHEAWQGQGEPSNGSLRDLDQSWRLADENRDEVILVGRLRQAKGPAEAVTAGPDSPSRLWLDKLPADGGPRPELRGTLRQDTVVRVFLPLAPEPRAEGK